MVTGFWIVEPTPWGGGAVGSTFYGILRWASAASRSRWPSWPASSSGRGWGRRRWSGWLWGCWASAWSRCAPAPVAGRGIGLKGYPGTQVAKVCVGRLSPSSVLRTERSPCVGEPSFWVVHLNPSRVGRASFLQQLRDENITKNMTTLNFFCEEATFSMFPSQTFSDREPPTSGKDGPSAIALSLHFLPHHICDHLDLLHCFYLLLFFFAGPSCISAAPLQPARNGWSFWGEVLGTGGGGSGPCETPPSPPPAPSPYLLQLAPQNLSDVFFFASSLGLGGGSLWTRRPACTLGSVGRFGEVNYRRLLQNKARNKMHFLLAIIIMILYYTIMII